MPPLSAAAGTCDQDNFVQSNIIDKMLYSVIVLSIYFGFG